jgi:nitroreductase
MKNSIHKIRYSLSTKYWILKNSFLYFTKLIIHNASVDTDNEILKMQYTIIRENHVIEKGMSMRNPRVGFGQEKVFNLLKRLDKYVELYFEEDKDFLVYPLSTVYTYIKYTKNQNIEIPIIEDSFEKILNHTGIKNIHEIAGIKYVNKQDIIEKCNKDFESLLFSRHSIRYFDKKPVDFELIKHALFLAQRTPSACNRQAWFAHVFLHNRSVDLVKWQGGAKGFEDEISCSILVTSNLNAFFSYEIYQAYIDGGMYAMNLINSLHSLGLGTVPLSCGFNLSKLKALNIKFDIPENEIPIMIIGVGNLLDDFYVAVSERKPISKTFKIH